MLRLGGGLTSAEELGGLAEAWRSWAAQPQAVFWYTSGQLLAINR